MAGKKKENVEPDGFIVVEEFRDRENFNTIHSVGSDVSHLDQSILDSLVSRGLVEAPSKEDAKAKAAAEKAQADADKKKEEEDAKAKAAAETE